MFPFITPYFGSGLVSTRYNIKILIWASRFAHKKNAAALCAVAFFCGLRRAIRYISRVALGVLRTCLRALAAGFATIPLATFSNPYQLLGGLIGVAFLFGGVVELLLASLLLLLLSSSGGILLFVSAAWLS